MGRHDPFLLFRDPEGGWCAAPPGFRDLLRDPIGRGPTRVDAVRDLLAHPDFIHRAKLGEWPAQPGLAAFVESCPESLSDFAVREAAAQFSNWRASLRRQSFRLVWDAQAAAL